MAKTKIQAKKKAKAVKTKKPVKTLKAATKNKTAKKAKKTVVASTKKSPKSSTSKPRDTKLNLNLIVSPLDDRVMVKLLQEEKITAGGIIIPDTSSTTGQLRGVVVAIGRGHRDGHGRIRPMDVKIGDEVLLPEYAGDKVEVMGHQVQILRESDVLGIVD